MEAYLLAVGNELITGKTLNTNSFYLAGELEKLGIQVKKILAVGDNKIDITNAVSEFLKSSGKLLITTGGLGPTHDDFTKEVICEVLGLNLVPNAEATKDMFNYFGEAKTDCNVKQTYFPEVAKIIPNHNGSADGAIIEYEDKVIMMLVGPPYELKPMFEETCIPYLETLGERKLVQDFIVMGNSESYFEAFLSNVFNDYPNVEINPYADNKKIRYRITTEKENIKDFYHAIEDFKDLMDNYIISENDETIEEVVVKELTSKGLTISFAESCTGGMLAQMITSVPDSSKVFKESVVTYSGEAKNKYLHVDEETINTKIVSEECAQMMAKGLVDLTSADICVAITGYAGPTGEEVGKVCYAIKAKDILISGEKKFRGNREMVRIRASRYLLYQIHIILKEII